MAATNLVQAAAMVVDPRGGQVFGGSLAGALSVMVEYAALLAEMDGDKAQTSLTMNLRCSNPDRVAEVCAAALLRLAEAERG